MARNHWSDALVFGSLFFKQEDYYNIVLNYMVCEGYQKEGNPMFTLLATLTDSSQAILWKDEEVTQKILDQWQQHVCLLLLALPQTRSESALERI